MQEGVFEGDRHASDTILSYIMYLNIGLLFANLFWFYMDVPTPKDHLSAFMDQHFMLILYTW